MDTLFVLLLLASLIGLAIGLIKPSIVRLKTRKLAGLVFGGVAIVFFILFGIATPSPSAQPAASQQSAPVAVANTTSSTTSAVPSTPLTEQQKVQNAVSSVIQQNASSWATIKNVDDELASSYGVKDMPSGSKLVTIDIETGTFWDDSATVTQTGKLASQIMQQVFPINSKFNEVLVRYYGQLTDAYGNTKDDMMLSYEMDREIYSKINWSGFSDTLNDIHFCAFLKNQSNIWQATESSNADQSGLYVGCAIMLNSLQKAEASIEAGQ